MLSAMSSSLIATPRGVPGATRPEGLSTGSSGVHPAVRLSTEPECQSCGPIAPPAAWTASITAFQPASASPWKNGMPGSLRETGRSITVPSDRISPT